MAALMRISRHSLSLFAVILLLFPSPSRARSGEGALKAEGAATRWSLLGTVAPIGVGAFWWAAQSGSYNPRVIDNDGNPLYVEPNRTVPSILLLGGLVLGSSLGHFYAGRPGRALASMGLRAGLLVGGIGAAVAIEVANDHGDRGTSEVYLGALGGVVAASAVYDIATAGRSVRIHNGTQEGMNLLVTPAYFAAAKAGGVRISAGF